MLAMLETHMIRLVLALSIFWCVCSCIPLSATESKTMAANVDGTSRRWNQAVESNRNGAPIDSIHEHYEDRDVHRVENGHNEDTSRLCNTSDHNEEDNDSVQKLSLEILKHQNYNTSLIIKINIQIRNMDKNINEFDKQVNRLDKEVNEAKLTPIEHQMKQAAVINGLCYQMSEDMKSKDWRKSVELMKRHLDHSTQAYKQLNNITDYDNLPLSVARYGYIELLQVMLYNRLLINTGYDENNCTMIYEATISGQYDVVQLLIEHGADLNVREEEGKAPLHMAAAEGYLNIVQLLVESGADINPTNKHGWTPLHWAAQREQKSVVQWLVDNGCDTTIRNKNGQTARDIAITEEIKNILKEK